MIQDFKDIDHLSHQDFEIFVRDLLLASGWTDAVITKVGAEYRHGDGGVDIFAQRGGRRFAIEVKQRDINTSVDVKALSQLVTGARLAHVSNMILVTNAYFTSEVKVRALRLGVELIDRDELQNLWIKKHSEIGREIKPRTYQVDVITEAIRSYESGKTKLLIEMATGLGKTYTVALLTKELMQRGRRARVLFVAHQVEILLQSVTAFKNVLGIGNYSYSACFAGAAPEDTDFVFASFDTLYGQLAQLKRMTFDYVIVDEAHHTPARTYNQVIASLRPRLLIGLTATPYRTDNQSVVELFGGPDGHLGKYDLVWGLQNRKLAFPKYMVLLDDLDQRRIDQLETGLSIQDLDKRLFLHKKDEEVVKIIERTIRDKQIACPKGIVFCRNIRHLKHLLGFFEAGTATCVHSKMNDQERRENIRRFREGDLKFILVCDLFNEGIDIPETNVLVFMRYTGSRTVWLQQLGRGLRKTPNKDYVHVLDFVGSLERLEDVRLFAREVNSPTPRPPSLADLKEPRGAQESVHDSTLEVTYSESAAKVLELIERLQYRLNTREGLIQRLREFYSQHSMVPEIEDLEEALDNITADQVATYFDSYFGYQSAALGSAFHFAPMAQRLNAYVDMYRSKYGARPSAKAVCLNFTHGPLPEFTEREIVALAPSLMELLEDPAVVSHETEEVPDVGADMRNQLLMRYAESISSRADVFKLGAEERAAIDKVFRSPSLFLKALRSLKTA